MNSSLNKNGSILLFMCYDMNVSTNFLYMDDEIPLIESQFHC